MAYEPSEIMFAAAMLFPDKQLQEATASISNLKNFMGVAKKRAMSSVKFGNKSIQDGFIDLMEPTDKGLKDLAVGISAAISMRKKVSSAERKGTPTVYMTGNVWPKEVEKFRVSAYGFDDYNSADVLFSYNNTKFYGVSLKKKPNSKSPEPTLINKAFDTLLGDGKEFKALRDELTQARIDYFASLVIQAVNAKIIKKADIKGFDALTKTKEGRKELFEAKKRDKTKFDRSYIDTKGFADASDGYKDDNAMRDPKSMRTFVNKKLADPKNELWSKFIAIMNQYSSLFGDSLITIILKTKLYKELSAADLKKYKFAFYLVTGVADINKSGVVIGDSVVNSLETTLCGLTRIEEKAKKSPYTIELNQNKKGTSDAAKIFLQLKRGKVVILDLELRYKGAFTPQPQFQATLNPQFKTLLKDECGI